MEAVPGSLVCQSCEERTRAHLRALPGIYGDLLERPSGRGGIRGTRVDPPEPLAEGQLDARADILLLVTHWLQVITATKGLARFDPDQVLKAGNRELAGVYSAAAMARQHCDHEAAAAHLTHAGELGLAIQSGQHVLAAMVERIDVHYLWALAQPTIASSLVRQIRHVHWDATHPTNPPDTTQEQQPARELPDLPAMTLRQLADWAPIASVGITHHRLEQWVRDRRITPTTPARVGAPSRYDPAAVAAVALHLERTRT